jgi:hypothetical protein
MFCPRDYPTGKTNRQSPQTKALAHMAVQYGLGIL